MIITDRRRPTAPTRPRNRRVHDADRLTALHDRRPDVADLGPASAVRDLAVMSA